MDIKLLESLKTAIPLMPGFVYLKDKQGAYLVCSLLMAEAAGLISSSEIMGKTDFELPWKELANDIRKSDLEILSTGKSQSIEECLPIADNKKMVILCNKTAITDQNGSIQGLLGCASDITLSKQQHAALQASRDQTTLALENILGNIPAHIFWKDRDCILLGCNDQQAKNMGFLSGKEMAGKSNYDVISPNQPEQARKTQADAITKVDLEVMATGIDYVVEEPLVLPDGTTAIYLSKKTPLRNKQGEIVGLLGIAFDITDKKKAEQELQETRHKLEGMTLVSASIAHEIRTPLATLNINADTLKGSLPHLIKLYEHNIIATKLGEPSIDKYTLEGLKELPNIIKRETHGANTFINMLLMNVNPELDGNPAQTFSILACVNEALERYPFKPGQRELVIWNASHDFQVRGKQKLVVHILFNLIKNALFYVRNGYIKIELGLGETSNKLSFTDTGTGIAPDILPHIFGKFFSRTRNGAGVGLAFCKTVMETLGGTITCESIEGSYTKFILCFPLVTSAK